MNFAKVSATGNSFITLDNREGLPGPLNQGFLQTICRRTASDGVILIQDSRIADLRMRFFNPDGREAELCGNGLRAAASWVHHQGFHRREMTVETLSGVQRVWVREDSSVRIQIKNAEIIRLNMRIDTTTGGFIRVGVPHFVIFTEDVEGVDVPALGRRIRYHTAFQPAGTNVDFVQVLEGGDIKVRTYERGVERETLSCGTGVIASAIISHLGRGLDPPLKAFTKGGVLKVDFNEDFSKISLEGKVHILWHGEIPEKEISGP